MSFDQRFLGNVKVTNGVIAIADPNNHRLNVTRLQSDSVIHVSNEDRGGQLSYGVVVAAGENIDCSFPVFGTYDEHGELKSVEIRFKDEE